MVHNGIEYGMMQAFAEGYELMAASGIVKDVPGTLASWRQGTVVRSWSLDLLVRALKKTLSWSSCADTLKTPVKDAGPCKPPLTTRCPPQLSPPPCTPGSPPGRRTARR